MDVFSSQQPARRPRISPERQLPRHLLESYTVTANSSSIRQNPREIGIYTYIRMLFASAANARAAD
jgi:hypothetical protein